MSVNNIDHRVVLQDFLKVKQVLAGMSNPMV